jgi:predicted TPR repeat methyltransferase
MGKHEEAVESFDKALALQPDLKIAQDNRALALLELKKVDRIPAHAVRTLFDDYASYYDDALLGSLKKRDHTNLRVLADRVLAPGTKGLRILDLGCGTGISGEAFKDFAEGGIMDGIDLSSLMLDGARARGLYRNLIAGDFETVLASHMEHYDLIVAVDALNYHGDLVPTLRGAARCLVPGGLCLFTVEQKQGQGWEHTPANRFRHSETYLREAAAAAGLDFADLMQCELRNESQEPVAGFAVALKKKEGD